LREGTTSLNLTYTETSQELTSLKERASYLEGRIKEREDEEVRKRQQYQYILDEIKKIWEGLNNLEIAEFRKGVKGLEDLVKDKSKQSMFI
jgi:hypothetical protein